MRDYLNKLGKRSSSIDTGINDTSQAPSNDPWRIFSNFTEFKGKLTKTVEEKLSEIKSKNNDNENSPKFGDKYKTSSKDNSSISDSEEPSYSECSVAKSAGVSSTAEDAEMSSEDEDSVENDRTPTAPYKLPLTPELRHRHKPNVQITYKKDQDEIQVTTYSTERNADKPEEEIESGVEAIDETSTLDIGLNLAPIDFAPRGFVDMRPKILKIQKNNSFSNLILTILCFLTVLLYFYPIFTLGFLLGLMFSTIFFGVYFLFKTNREGAENEEYFCKKSRDIVPILEIPAVKEYQAVTKFEVYAFQTHLLLI